MKEKLTDEFCMMFERAYPDLMHLPEGGMSVWLEESYMNGMVDWWLGKLQESNLDFALQLQKKIFEYDR